jgi:hypothetical protein
LLLAETKESERWIPHQNSKEHTKRLRERVGRETSVWCILRSHHFSSNPRYEV